MAKHGEFTAKVGAYLQQHLEPKGFQVAYDHGDKEKGSGTIVSSLGREPRRGQGLSQVDIAVLKRQGESLYALVLLEIEEKKSTPKIVLGDIFCVLLGQSLSFAGESISAGPYTSLIVAAVRGARQLKKNQELALVAEKCRAALGTPNAAVGEISVISLAEAADAESMLLERVQAALDRGMAALR